MAEDKASLWFYGVRMCMLALTPCQYIHAFLPLSSIFDLSILWLFHSTQKPAQVSCIPLTSLSITFQLPLGLSLTFLKRIIKSDYLNFLIFHFVLHSLKSGLTSQYPRTFTEAVQIMVTHDVLITRFSAPVSVFIFLDLSAAFETIYFQLICRGSCGHLRQ